MSEDENNPIEITVRRKLTPRDHFIAGLWQGLGFALSGALGLIALLAMLMSLMGGGQ